MLNPKMIAFRYATLLILMLLDIISGVVKVKRNGQKFSSAKMATGLYKKISTILCMAVADILSEIFYVIEINISLVMPVYIYIVVMETLSVIENSGEAKIKELVDSLLKGLRDDSNK